MRYGLFMFEHCEGAGGWNDLKGQFATIAEAQAAAVSQRFGHPSTIDKAHIVDFDERRIVLGGEWEYDPPRVKGQPITWRLEWKEPGA
jgi:hypothetical protein